jgi:predicted transcriptional regulator
MTPEEMERSIQFIIGQQAQFSADIQKLTENQAKLTESQKQLTDATLANTGMIGTIIRMLDKITENQANLTEAQTQTNVKVGELAERLDNFIVVVEKFITESRNGKSKG